MINVRTLCTQVGIRDYNSFTRRIRQSGLLEGVDYLIKKVKRRIEYWLTHTESAIYWLSKSNKVKQFRGISHVDVNQTIQPRNESSVDVYDGELVDSSKLSREVRRPSVSDASSTTHEQPVFVLDAFTQSVFSDIKWTITQILALEKRERERIAREKQQDAREKQRDAREKQQVAEQKQRDAEREHRRSIYAERYARIQRAIAR